MAAPKSVVEPHKELRFTRAGQAQLFFIVSAVALAFGLILTLTWWLEHPSFHWWMPLPLFVISALMMRVAIFCARHAYIILTPMGVEIFPLRKAEENLQLIYWTELDHADFNKDTTLARLHRDKEETSGVVLSLKPIRENQRPLLKSAIEGRLKADKSLQAIDLP